jgi:signal transduction histidine kinase
MVKTLSHDGSFVTGGAAMERGMIERILVVDDEPMQCEMIQDILKMHGYGCESTTSAMDALAMLEGDQYDLVVSDIRMEEKDGLELLMEVRSRHPDMNLIIMTGFADHYAYSQIIDAGAADFIAKPFQMGELLTKIRRIEREKQTECELRRHRDHLEQLVESRTEELSRTNELLHKEIKDRIRIESALRDSDGCVRQLNEHILHMLMVMSHDIRGPLVAVAAMVKLLLRGVYGGLDDSVRNTVKDLLSRIVQVLGIAEDCLGKAYAVDGSIKLEREMLDLRQGIIDPILDEIATDIEKHGITIDNRLGSIPAGTIPIKANKIWLKAVFRNLFKNAVKYGGDGCTIAFGFEDHGSSYRLNVYNSGRPVPDEHRDKLFTRFGRISDSGGGSPEGIGLGLYLIKEIVRKHGGDIWYEARHDGSDFVFTIPKD